MVRPANPTPTTELFGTVQEFRDAKGRPYWRARITLPDGERVWLKPRFTSKRRAEEHADEQTREAADRELTFDKVGRELPLVPRHG